ncbi:class I SAM-dependent methyltransferase [Seleniivibrio sp.]|uniref:class I SAM-dependent methyltransferase n=1 Tax=Seleniivibrio sp. TaxID=2898801 RepID=UPI0025FC77B5|nr:class I SAM-dependent methyltransferase [Seleniivibrio sp.]MCD8553731.1 class I SAM-dependent methyltransferase [Seleniivibrio sp.]
MDFYRMLSEGYDEIFPYSPDAAALVKSFAPPKGFILDVGSATGQYIKRYSRSGYNAYGLEYVPELIHFKENTVVGDMTDLPYSPVFDVVSCMGNTLAHCRNYTHAENIIRGFYDVLKPNGTAVVQILNYHRILTINPLSLPEIRTEHYVFKRYYEYIKNHISFKGVLKGGRQSKTSTVTLYPLTPRELLDASMAAGFRCIEYMGDFKSAGFEMSDDFILVAVLKK